MATITGTFSNQDITAQTGRVVFSRITVPDEVSGLIVNGTQAGTTPTAGVISITLHEGLYRVYPNPEYEMGRVVGDYIIIEVPSGSGSYDLSTLIVSTSGSASEADGKYYTLATLRARTRHAADDGAFLYCLTTAGDGGAGNFRYSTSSEATDDGGLSVIKPNNVDSGDPGRWLRVS